MEGWVDAKVGGLQAGFGCRCSVRGYVNKARLMYAKVFASLWDGSLRGRPDDQLVFIYLLAHADRRGIVEVIHSKIADDTGLSDEQVTTATTRLEEPDTDSRSAEAEGRAIVPLDEHRTWGWRITNYEKYRAIVSEETRREKDRERQEKHRLSRPVTPSHAPSRKSRHAEGEAEVDTEADTEAEKKKTTPLSPGGDDVTWTARFSEFWEAYPHHPRRSHRPESLIRWNKLKPKGDALFAEIMAGLNASIAAGDWTRDQGQFVEAAEVWIGNHRWDASAGNGAGRDVYADFLAEGEK